MAIRLVASDIDGTLIRRDQSIPKVNIEAIQFLSERGILFAVTTGRMSYCAKSVCDRLRVEYGVFGNGIQVIDMKENKILYENAIEKEIVMKIIQLARKAGKHVHIYTEKILVSERLLYHDLRYYKMNMGTKKEDRVNIYMVVDLLKYVQESDAKIMKLLVSDFNMEESFILDVKEQLGEKAMIVTEGFRVEDIVIHKVFSYIEIVPKEATKANGLKRLIQYLGIGAEEVLAIGDGVNDMELLEMAGTSVAVANAQETVKEVAQFVTMHNNSDGAFAEMIEKFLK